MHGKTVILPLTSTFQELRLSFNELSGQLPTEWSGLNALTAFSLQFNQNLSGTVPTQYDQLGSNLREALLDSTDLCGAYPPGTGMLPQLPVLGHPGIMPMRQLLRCADNPERWHYLYAENAASILPKFGKM